MDDAEPRWPDTQLFLTPAELEALAERCRPGFVAACEAMRIDADLTGLLESLYLPLAAWLRRRRADASRAMVVGVCGAQGSGKSTVCALLETVMAHAFGDRAVVLSIDDIYETRERREELARTVHPLFVTRGVPGTHDVALGKRTIERLMHQGPEACTAVPAFDKAVDTRLPREQWPRCRGRLDYVLFEGWCVGAVPQAPAELETPVNVLEREEDPDGAWREAVNEHLRGEYQALFALIDVLLMLRVEGMHRVFEWRRLQEHKLAERAAAAPAAAPLRIMSDAEVDRFVMHYERLTRHILAEMPRRADVVLDVDASHVPARTLVNTPLETGNYRDRMQSE